MADPTDFVQRLRMNNIFPTAGFNPLGPPQRQSLDVNGILRQIGAMQANARNDAANEEENRYYRAKGDRLAEIARQNAIATQQRESSPLKAQGGMNVVLGNAPMSDYQKGSLALGKERLAQTGNLQTQKLEQAGNIAEGKQTVAEGKLGVSQQDSATRKARADIYAFKAQHPNMKIVADKGGNFFAIDPITGKSMDTGVGTGTLDEREKLEITGSQAMERTNANIQGRKDVAEQQHGYRTEEIGTRGTEQRKTNESKPAKELSPTQQQAEINNNARKIANTRPDLAKYLEIAPNGSFTISPSGSDVIDQTLESLLYGKDIKLGNSNLPAQTPSPTTQNNAGPEGPPLPPGYQFPVTPIQTPSGPMVMVNGQPMSLEEYNNTQQTPNPAAPSSRYRVTIGTGGR